MELRSGRSRLDRSLPSTFFLVWGTVGLLSLGYLLLAELRRSVGSVPEGTMAVLMLGVPAGALLYAGYWLESAELRSRQIRAIGWYSVIGVALAVVTGSVVILFFPLSGVDVHLLYFYFISAGTEGALLGMLIGTAVTTDLFVGGRTALEAERDRLDEFASVLAHDLRNPLNVAQARVSLARRECSCEHLEEAATAHDRMADLIDDCLILARHGESAVETDPVDLSETVDRAWQSVDTGNARLANDTTRTVSADEGMLRRLFENLFDNAVEHAAADAARDRTGGTGTDGVAITVGDLPDGFYVADDGPGIPADRRDRVFEPGYSTDEGGTGFGLRIVEAVVESHGWEIRVTESRHRGARFEVRDLDGADAW